MPERRGHRLPVRLLAMDARNEWLGDTPRARAFSAPMNGRPCIEFSAPA